MFVETTMCPSCSDFTKAVNTACTEIEDNLDSIDLPANHVFIKQMRLKGVDPIINLWLPQLPGPITSGRSYVHNLGNYFANRFIHILVNYLFLKCIIIFHNCNRCSWVFKREGDWSYHRPIFVLYLKKGSETVLLRASPFFIYFWWGFILPPFRSLVTGMPLYGLLEIHFCDWFNALSLTTFHPLIVQLIWNAG